MPSSSPSCRRLCLAAAVAWLLFASVFLTVGSAGPDPAACVTSAGRAVPACGATFADNTIDHGRTVLHGEIGPASKVWSLSGFVNDLRKPRPPRQRSERPTTGADGIEAMMTSSTLRLMLRLDQHRPFHSDAAVAGPQAGHYRSLLRPPSSLS